MDVFTHCDIDMELCGIPIEIMEKSAKVQLKTTDRMGVDSHGLVHGGFIFGVADYAAMLAVNHPNVVLGSSDVRFLKPVRIGEVVIAEAKVIQSMGKKRIVHVEVFKEPQLIFDGTFTCFVLDHHVLS